MDSRLAVFLYGKPHRGPCLADNQINKNEDKIIQALIASSVIINFAITITFRFK